MCICVYVYMCICVYVYMCICVYVYMCICVYVYMCICVYVYMYLCIYVYMYNILICTGLLSPGSRPLEWRSTVNLAQEVLVTSGCLLVAVNFAVDRRKTSFQKDILKTSSITCMFNKILANTLFGKLF